MIDIHYSYPLLQDPTIEAHKDNYFETGSLCINHYKDCYGLPYKALAKEDINYVGGGLKISDNLNIGTIYDFKFDEGEKVDQDIIFIGHISSVCWGHTITDSIGRLWWIVTEIKKKYNHLPIYYISETHLDGNYLEFIKLIGIPLTQFYRISKITLFRSVYIPDTCFDNHRISLRYTKEYVSLIDHICRQGSNIFSPRKIFLMRENSLRQICSSRLSQIIIDSGYHLIFPEKLSVPDQISLFQNAESIVSEESSLSHNFIFCREGTKVVILRKVNTVNIYQALINQLRHLDVVYIDCHLSICINQRHRGPFFLYANDNLCSYFNYMTPDFPYDEFASYIEDACGKNIWNNIYHIDSCYREIIENLITH
ncbi:MAG: glycosyltransferase family 61 protein [Bacteroidales bacterium]|nr:glycosyltransferase family 61 protein [Bacteroidales bacterium]